MDANGRRVHWPKKPWTRFLLGYPINGYWKTNATWLQTGDKQTGIIDSRSRFAFMPGYQRFAVRIVGLSAMAEIGVGAAVDPLGTEIAWGGGGIVTASATGYRAYQHWVTKESRRIASVVRSQVSEALAVASPMVEVERDKTRVTEVRVTLPLSFALSTAKAKNLDDLVRRAVGTDWETEWPSLIDSRVVLWNRPIEPVMDSLYEDLRGTMLGLKEGEILFGVDRNNVPYVRSIDGDAPHIAMSMATGRGKSTLYRLILAQLLEQGAEVDICDVKRISLHEFRDVENVTIHRDVATIWDVIDLFEQEVGERYRILEQLPEADWPEYLASLRRKVLVFEEMNAFRLLSQQHWDAIRSGSDRAMPPAFQAFARILMMARAVKMHVLIAGQRLEAATVGGGANRECFGVVILSNPTKQTWAMFGSGTKPKGSKVPGRALALFADEHTVVQIALATKEQAVEHCEYRRNVESFVLPSYVRVSQAKEKEIVVGQSTLSDALKFPEFSGMTLSALQRASSRDEFPVSVGMRGPAKTYDDAALRHWITNRPRSRPVGDTPSFDPSVTLVDSTELP